MTIVLTWLHPKNHGALSAFEKAWRCGHERGEDGSQRVTRIKVRVMATSEASPSIREDGFVGHASLPQLLSSIGVIWKQKYMMHE